MAILDVFKKKKKNEEKNQVEAKPAEAKNAAAAEAPAKKNVGSTNAKAEEKAVKAEAKAPTTEKTKAKAAPKAAKEEVKPAAEPVQTTEAETDSKGYTGRFEINKSKDGKKFFFNLYASNKVGIATSQMYSTAQNALNGIKSVIANAPKAPIEDQSLKKYESLPYPKWEIYIDNGGKFRFRLNASNGSCVCHSQGYTTKTACKNGIESIIRSSRNAEIDKNYLLK